MTIIIPFIGYAVAWLISNREDEVTLTLFFQKVKERCPTVEINALMTDDGNTTRLVIIQSLFVEGLLTDLAGVNGCKAVYPHVAHLLCKWHVDRYITVHLHVSNYYII